MSSSKIEEIIKRCTKENLKVEVMRSFEEENVRDSIESADRIIHAPHKLYTSIAPGVVIGNDHYEDNLPLKRTYSTPRGMSIARFPQ